MHRRLFRSMNYRVTAKFVSLAGAGGAVDVYIKPEGGYGVAGIEGQIPPNSMSMIKLNVLKIE